ncbi:NACHT domain-containing protein [Fusarium falciforme]|uniref:NACHT domain-containing protein n=1 Tax=Fusarium falciforme TaxID=195108 RepID=UPI00230021E4|nr:NACHT domain-containing protein [Fusarium falciforme]WAO86156.1 NACHT domain-containing protein [Fusarium falciforme]
MPRNPAVTVLARQTLKTAYDELERTITPGDKRNFGNTTLQHVRKTALDIENQLAARQSLRNMRRLMPLFRGLEHYSKVVDILCNGTPYLPWIWAPITLILRIASEYVEAFEKIIKGYSNIAESLKRFEILGDAFRGEPEFHKTLAVFYADILEFHKNAYKFVRRSGWKLMFVTSWGRFESKFNNILEDLNRHGSLIDQEANALDIAEARKMREDIRSWREESQSQLDREQAEKSAKQFEATASWLKINESDQLTIFDSIISEVAEHQGTCAWILKNQKVRSWLQDKPDTPALWLQGSAGTGKSVLCTQLAIFMKASNSFTIHHFCTYRYASSTAYEQILKSLILQLVRKDGDLVAHVNEAYVLEKKPPTTVALEQLFQTLLANMSSRPNQEELRQLDIGQAEIEEIRTVIVEKADGMFLYARLVMDYLATNIFYSGDEIKQSVNELPRKLADFYYKILTQILVQLDSRSVDRVRCILGWVAFAERPLQKLELLSAISFSPGDPKINRLAPQYILDICGTLIEERRDSTLAFIHISVKEFLQSSSSNIVIHKQQALREHGVATVTCLLSGLRLFGGEFSEHDRVLRIGKGLHGFHVYATEYWTEYLLSHIARADGIDTNSPELLMILACQLADVVKDSSPEMAVENDGGTSQLDERLPALRQYPALYRILQENGNVSRDLDTLGILEI